MIKIALLDDHNLFRAGLVEIFKSQPDFNIVAEYSTPDECKLSLSKDSPDILLLDVSIDNELSYSYIDSFRTILNNLKIIMLTMHKKEFYVTRALELQVNGYINKDVDSGELFLGIRKVNNGSRFFSSDISELMLNNIYASKPDHPTGIKELTSREMEVLENILAGNTSTQIAERLVISKKTVDNHRANILKKFGFKNTNMLIKELMATGKI
ncbi:MAG: response regulator transcription factor [Fulvivirga sp.]|uniref:response regulator transcription factor n=1 Tax=Fulvivirga sp. TaxID=1931237 RepID=UPI0032ED093C